MFLSFLFLVVSAILYRDFMKKMNGLIDVLLSILSFSAIKTSHDELKKVENRSSVKDFLSSVGDHLLKIGYRRRPSCSRPYLLLKNYGVNLDQIWYVVSVG